MLSLLKFLAWACLFLGSVAFAAAQSADLQQQFIPNVQGKNTGETFPNGIPWNIVQKAGQQLRSCKFKIYLVNGQPWYHHIDFVFTEP